MVLGYALKSGLLFKVRLPETPAMGTILHGPAIGFGHCGAIGRAFERVGFRTELHGGVFGVPGFAGVGAGVTGSIATPGQIDRIAIFNDPKRYVTFRQMLGQPFRLVLHGGPTVVEVGGVDLADTTAAMCKQGPAPIDRCQGIDGCQTGTQTWTRPRRMVVESDAPIADCPR